jgi:spermidine synthase
MASCIDVSEQKGVRYLHFGSEWVQGAMRIARPVNLELAYTREMMAGLLMRDEKQWPRRILLIGLGAASLTKFCYWKLPQSKMTVVEIDERVVSAAQQFFKLPPQDIRLQIEIADGVDYVSSGNAQFDYILVDGYDENAKVGALDSLPFYQACWSRLSDNGLLAVNLFGRARRYGPSIQRMSEAFDTRAMAFPSCDSGNVIAFAALGEAVEVSAGMLRERASALFAETGLDLRPTVSRLEEANILEGGVLRF